MAGINGKAMTVVLSAGGDHHELAEWGLGMEHIDELMVRFARASLNDGHRLAFGGTLGDQKQKLTQYLIDTALSWLTEKAASTCEVTKPATWPVVNYSAWPFHTFINAEQRARLVGVCQFVDVWPPSVARETLQDLLGCWTVNPQAQIYTGNGLARMREQSTEESDLRVVWGGKIAGSSGWMARILEEVGYSLALNKPVLILGGFGGCARRLADYLIQKDAEWPADLTLNISQEQAGLLPESARTELTARFEKIKADLTNYRQRLNDGEKLNGIDSQIIQEALSEENGRRATVLVARAVASINATAKEVQ